MKDETRPALLSRALGMSSVDRAKVTLRREEKELEGLLAGLPLNRHGKRAGHAIIRRFFLEKKAAAVRARVRIANREESRLTQGQRIERQHLADYRVRCVESAETVLRGTIEGFSVIGRITL
jgi:hypothetical protein